MEMISKELERLLEETDNYPMPASRGEEWDKQIAIFASKMQNIPDAELYHLGVSYFTRPPGTDSPFGDAIFVEWENRGME